MHFLIFSSLFASMATLILVILGLILLIKYIWPKFKKAVRNKDLTLAILIMVMSAIIFMPLFIVEGLFMIFEWDKGEKT